MAEPRICGICKKTPDVYTMKSQTVIICIRCKKSVKGKTRDEAIERWDSAWGKAGS